MRQIVLDTETTGLEPDLGHRIIEIGGIELVNRRRTGRTFHHYLNPEREIDQGALEVHGITAEFLQGKPRFAEVAEELMAFISGAELVIHNAAFDVAFLDAELRSHGAKVPTFGKRLVSAECRVLDTLALARSMHPGQRNNLDALCKRYEIDNSHRELHGALLDARILADVYLAMTGGQVGLALDELMAGAQTMPGAGQVRALLRPAIPLVVIRATAEEMTAHHAMLQTIAKESKGQCLWQTLEPAIHAGPASGTGPAAIAGSAAKADATNAGSAANSGAAPNTDLAATLGHAAKAGLAGAQTLSTA